MDDLTAFITARIDEDEAIAREAASALPRDEGHGWTAVHRYLETHPASGESFIVDTSSELVATATSARSYDRAVADHIARHDPARVRREVAAKRAMVERYHDAVDTQGEYGMDGSEWVAERMLKCIAGVWSDHPDYKQEWAP